MGHTKQFMASLVLSTLGLLISIDIFARSKLFDVFDVEQVAEARYPFPYVEGKIYHSRLGGIQKTPRPIKRCVLFHGHGVTQGYIDFFFRKQGLGANLARLLVTAQGVDPVHAFAATYFGGYSFLEKLRRDVCDEVVFAVQESTQSTLWEMTKRSEAFLAKEICGDQNLLPKNPDQKSCAIIGHSKGGAMVSLMALRCQERSSEYSELCANLDEVYSMSGALGGIALSSLLLGLKLQNESALVEDFFDKLWGLPLLVPAWSRDNLDELNLALGVPFDVFSSRIAKRTNPTWHDLSPLTELDRGIPSGLRFANAHAEKGGWFQGEYAASGVSHEFSEPEHPLGEGTQAKRDLSTWVRLEELGKDGETKLLKSVGEFAGTMRQLKEHPDFIELLTRDISQRFSQSLPTLHLDNLREIYELGNKEMKSLARHVNPELELMVARQDWAGFQKSDGIVDAEAALGFCRRSYQKLAQQKKYCHLFQNKEDQNSLNHYAVGGFAVEAAEHLIQELTTAQGF